MRAAEQPAIAAIKPTNAARSNGTSKRIVVESAGMTEKHSKVLGAAIFGAGWVAGEHARAYQKCERTRLVAVGSRKAESARKCAEYAGVPDAFVTTDFDALLKRPDVDVVSITTPPDSHPELTVRAARA